MRVLVCGSRSWTDWKIVGHALKALRPTAVIAGGANGADTFAADWARFNDVPLEEHQAEWDLYGKAAGPRRNQQMLDKGHPDCVLAFSSAWPLTPGTADMVGRAGKAGLPIKIWVEGHS